MGSQPNLARSGVYLQMLPPIHKFWGPLKLGAQKNINFYHFSSDFSTRHRLLQPAIVLGCMGVTLLYYLVYLPFL